MTYDPVADDWESVAAPPINVTTATAVWSGELVLVIGAHLNGENHAPTRTAVGASFDPTTGRWAELPSPGLLPFAVTAGWDGRRMIGWEYGLESEAYDPSTARWTGLPKVPLQFQECYPSSAAMQHFVFGEYCGQQTLFDGRSEIWRAVSRPGFRSFGFTLVAADPVFVLLGRSIETQAVAMLAYRPA